MVILTLAAICICRFHVKRRWSFRYYANAGSSDSDSGRESGSRIVSSVRVRSTHSRHQRSRRNNAHSGKPEIPVELVYLELLIIINHDMSWTFVGM